MKNNWQFFILIESLLFVYLIFQIFSTVPLMIAFVAGLVMSIWSLKNKFTKGHNNSFFLVLGGLLVVFVLLSTSSIWLMLIFAIFFFSISGNQLFTNMKRKNFSNAPWKRKSLVVVETSSTTEKNGKRMKRPWIGNERIGNAIYEWDDINFSILAGDTIIDLGNTLLPKDESFVVIRKGFGKTRILVPVGVGVMIEHSAIRGKISFEGDSYTLKNETVKMYSDQYEESIRKIKIITNVLIGDIEVIEV
ncbi:cell wall-active antibiotics response protein LiaF [Carnobacterium divergens]|uniref:Uncharacterized protein n=1 Tax=Carnobacterium divergens TaxID=2748 RepID=A0A5F0MCN4_CARDV|nr:cell wall-active antibiotics response protein LiaF [Carnobacterium divergens]TFI70745.1 hypothetical protein CKN81_11295 [Carnobacterium divergens]TFI71614.1 hypothetical protein CKN58_11335 [Carnobacterium divergens]TFI76256.1 hypothetical protein CKN85_11390 [Carnobacterium divergens]TFI82128.1 hypothetical protein CKN56_11415 [Carnobacterium divergens]TFI94437.1 hypothetical protein CKN64_11355 [Carnobacterium divergens]